LKQVYLTPRVHTFTPLRSDTLFGLIAWGVRMIYGRNSVARFCDRPPVFTSTFPFLDSDQGRVHYFPRPLERGTRPAARAPWIHESAFLDFVAGKEAPLPDDDVPFPCRGRGGLWFLADGPGEHYLDAALGFLERFGFGGQGSTGGNAFDVEIREAEFLRVARTGELSVLLSLYLPTPAERRVIVSTARQPGSTVRYVLERRQGVAGGRLMQADGRQKKAVAMLREGSIVPCSSEGPVGALPAVGEGADAEGTFPVLQNGRAFLVPLVPLARWEPSETTGVAS